MLSFPAILHKFLYKPENPDRLEYNAPFVFRAPLVGSPPSIACPSPVRRSFRESISRRTVMLAQWQFISKQTLVSRWGMCRQNLKKHFLVFFCHLLTFNVFNVKILKLPLDLSKKVKKIVPKGEGQLGVLERNRQTDTKAWNFKNRTVSLAHCVIDTTCKLLTNNVATRV